MVGDGEKVHVFFPGAFCVDFSGAAPAAGQGRVVVELTGVVIPEEVDFRLREDGQNFLRIEHAIYDNTGEPGRTRSPFLGLQRQAAALSRQMTCLRNLPVHLNAQCFRSLGQGADHQRKLPTAQDFRLRRDKDLSGAAGNLQQTANFGGSVFRKGQHRAAGLVLKDNPMFPNPDHRTPKGDALHARNQPGQLTDGCYGYRLFRRGKRLRFLGGLSLDGRFGCGRFGWRNRSRNGFGGGSPFGFRRLRVRRKGGRRGGLCGSRRLFPIFRAGSGLDGFRRKGFRGFRNRRLLCPGGQGQRRADENQHQAKAEKPLHKDSSRSFVSSRFGRNSICFDITFVKIPCQEGNVGFGKIAEKFVEFTSRKRKTLGGFSWARRAGGWEKRGGSHSKQIANSCIIYRYFAIFIGKVHKFYNGNLANPFMESDECLCYNKLGYPKRNLSSG